MNENDSTIEELKRERDALRVEYESRAIWIEKMNKILGYDNSDGFHCTPDPHQIAAILRAELAAKGERQKQLEKALKESSSALYSAEMGFDLIANYGLPGESAHTCYSCMKDIAAENKRNAANAHEKLSALSARASGNGGRG